MCQKIPSLYDAGLFGALPNMSVQHQLLIPITKLNLTICRLAFCRRHGLVTIMRNRHIGNDGNNGGEEKSAGDDCSEA